MGREDWHGEPKKRRSPMDTGNYGREGKGKCSCPMVAAVRSARRGKLRLARRYLKMSFSIMVGWSNGSSRTPDSTAVRV